METPQKEDEQDEQRARDDDDDEESAPNYSPLDISPFCYFFHKVVKSLLNCFGHGDDNINPDIQQYSEAQMKVNEDRGISAASLRTVSRRPRRPPRSGLSTGSGGQTN